MNLNKQNNETDFEYHKRIIYGKLVDKTLADVDYTELSGYIYGQNYSSDVARRMFYGSKRTIDIVEKMNIDSFNSSGCEDNSTFDDLDNRIMELKKERQRFFDQRREFNKLVNKQGREEHLFDIISNAANSVGDLQKLDVSISTDYYNGQDKYNEAVLVFSDWHYGMITDNCYNYYNTEICKNRISEVVSSAIERIIKNNCGVVHIVILGDLIHGAIHTGARVASEELVCDQLMNVSEILANSISLISSCVPEVKVYATYGNHARTVQNKKDNIHSDNMEKIVPWWLKERFKSSGISNVEIIEQNDEIIKLNVNGHDICASHGDLDNVKKSPKLLSTLLRKTCGIDVEYIILGDKHHIESFNELGITSTICGSLCGSDDYANDKRMYSDPSQLLLIFDDKGVDAEYKLRCKKYF